MTGAANNVLSRFDLSGRVFVITGGAGLLGLEHAAAIAGAGGTPVLADLQLEAAEQHAAVLSAAHGVAVSAVKLDVTSPPSCQRRQANPSDGSYRAERRRAARAG